MTYDTNWDIYVFLSHLYIKLSPYLSKIYSSSFVNLKGSKQCLEGGE
jgi:hypothetical protein